MEQTASFSCVFICVIVSVCAASAALLELSSIPSLAPLDASLQRKVKGKIFEVHSYKLRPTRSSGKVVGDKGATGKMWLKGLKTAQQEFYFVNKLR
ncbi:unnamed protein product [Closterium sp. NIES-65]|nr:unnamed protein product [Closterium sp. NIES-65]